MKQKFFILGLILFISSIGFAQKQGNIWFFGRNAGVDFNPEKPVAITNGALNTLEGCASICDTDGNLLFYTDGISVWNKNNEVMANGDSLYGNPSSTQSGVIIPHHVNTNLYYIFTIDEEAGDYGFCYSIVDMTKQTGLGEITEKNVFVLDNVTEKITAVRHRENIGIWIITHKWKTDEFYTYLFTETGISTNPIISKTGSVHEGASTNTIGYLKASPDGSNLALAIAGDAIIELFDFDNNTGKVSNPIQIALSADAYAVEFSPNGSLLYISSYTDEAIFQYNLQAGSPEKIANSKIAINEEKNYCCSGALQLGPDRKIYYSIAGSEYLAVIESPNILGKDCNFVKEAVSLNGKKCGLGLPCFYQSYFDQQEFNDATYFDENKEIEEGKAIILNNILFATNQSSLKSKSFVELNKVLKILNENPEYKIQIIGHTDNVGNKSNNLKLSEDRAKSVGNYLISKGIADDRITYKGMGSSKPIVSNSTKEGRQKNRRVEFVLEK